MLTEWVERCPHSASKNLSLPRLAEGSEHIVAFSESDMQVYKLTRPGTFGESYFLHNGLVHQKSCTPLEYLTRLRLWDTVFPMAPRSLGITDSGQIVSVQPFISGVGPTQEAVDQYLVESGLLPVKKSCWLWKRTYPDFELWVGDARDDNFVESRNGITPIDLRLWYTEDDV